MDQRIHYLKTNPTTSKILVASDHGGNIFKYNVISGRHFLRIEKNFPEDWKWEPNFTSDLVNMNFGNDFSQLNFANHASLVKLHKANYLSVTNKLTFAALDNGSLEIKPLENENNKRCYQSHDQSVTDIKSMSDSRYITCAEDGKIKLWRYTDTSDMIQIGEFSGHGPAITVLDVDRENVMAGDAAGNVFFFSIIN